MNKTTGKEEIFHQINMIGKKNEKNNVTVVLNVLYTKKEKLYPAYDLKHNSNRERQIIF